MQNISQDLVIRLLPLKPTSNVPSLSFEIMAMIDETLFPVVNTSLFFFVVHDLSISLICDSRSILLLI
jgi:hypothetical protein